MNTNIKTLLITILFLIPSHLKPNYEKVLQLNTPYIKDLFYKTRTITPAYTLEKPSLEIPKIPKRNTSDWLNLVHNKCDGFESTTAADAATLSFGSSYNKCRALRGVFNSMGPIAQCMAKHNAEYRGYKRPNIFVRSWSGTIPYNLDLSNEEITRFHRDNIFRDETLRRICETKTRK